MIYTEQCSLWKNNNINDNFFNKIEAKEIMCILDEYIFNELDLQELWNTLGLDLEDDMNSEEVCLYRS